MVIAKKTEGDRMIIAVTGRVDTTTAPELDAGLKLAGNETLTLDLSGVPYMSSAGLRPDRTEDHDGRWRIHDHRRCTGGSARGSRHHWLQQHSHTGLIQSRR